MLSKDSLNYTYVRRHLEKKNKTNFGNFDFMCFFWGYLRKRKKQRDFLITHFQYNYAFPKRIHHQHYFLHGPQTSIIKNIVHYKLNDTTQYGFLCFYWKTTVYHYLRVFTPGVLGCMHKIEVYQSWNVLLNEDYIMCDKLTLSKSSLKLIIG